MKIHIHYSNGFVSAVPMPDNMRAAMRYARENISYSSGMVARVEIETEPGSYRAVWDAGWTPRSQIAGLSDAP